MGHYNSFVVRIWSEQEGRMRGSIEHVLSRESLAFIDPQAILAFIRAHLDTPPPTDLLNDGESDPPDTGEVR